jgi:hypothetical protein
MSLADPVSGPTVKRDDKSLPTLATELWELILTYLKQETLEPLKGLGRFIAYGMAGSILLATGLVVLTTAVLRVLQVETAPHWTGNWSWLPYVLTVIAVALVALLVASRIGSVKRKSQKGG